MAAISQYTWYRATPMPAARASARVWESAVEQAVPGPNPLAVAEQASNTDCICPVLSEQATSSMRSRARRPVAALSAAIAVSASSQVIPIRPSADRASARSSSLAQTRTTRSQRLSPSSATAEPSISTWAVSSAKASAPPPTARALAAMQAAISWTKRRLVTGRRDAAVLARWRFSGAGGWTMESCGVATCGFDAWLEARGVASAWATRPASVPVAAPAFARAWMCAMVFSARPGGICRAFSASLSRASSRASDASTGCAPPCVPDCVRGSLTRGPPSGASCRAPPTNTAC